MMYTLQRDCDANSVDRYWSLTRSRNDCTCFLEILTKETLRAPGVDVDNFGMEKCPKALNITPNSQACPNSTRYLGYLMLFVALDASSLALMQI